MLATILAPIEKKFRDLLDLMDVDASIDESRLKTVFISTEHDPGVGIRGGPVFTLWWALGTGVERKRWPTRIKEEDFPTDIFVVEEDWLVPKEEWQDEMDVILANRKIIFDAMMNWYMRPY